MEIKDRNKSSDKSTTFYCFSPLVMIITFLTETALLLYVLWRYKLNEITRLVALILVFLATFQLAEYMVCEGAGIDALTWARTGYTAITLLPPLGLHLAYALGGAKKRHMLWPAYIAASGFVAYFVLASSSLSGQACLGNYAIFEVGPAGMGWLYGAYYYVLLAAGVLTSWRLMRTSKNKKTRRALGGLIFGYAAFLLPTATVNLLNPSTTEGIPSIMCGFAVLLALMLAFVVVPAAVRKRSR